MAYTPGDCHALLLLCYYFHYPLRTSRKILKMSKSSPSSLHIQISTTSENSDQQASAPMAVPSSHSSYSKDKPYSGLSLASRTTASQLGSAEIATNTSTDIPKCPNTVQAPKAIAVGQKEKRLLTHNGLRAVLENEHE